ncbi:SMP-30/gluconolactonase/LRE family protein, partial [Xanthomonas perforans]
LMDDGRVLVALAKAIGIVDPDTVEEDALPFEKLADVEADNPLTRSNDGRVDRHGNLVFGTMDEHDSKAARGAFYQFSLKHGLR